mmetsp:Transcript_14298/g.35898  ORF Transcript_14298/g.35898 Transcript_14298/m.35898 type:complete len:109 (-) Transcript_14298:18-344(-)
MGKTRSLWTDFSTAPVASGGRRLEPPGEKKSRGGGRKCKKSNISDPTKKQNNQNTEYDSKHPAIKEYREVLLLLESNSNFAANNANESPHPIFSFFRHSIYHRNNRRM